MTSMITNSIYAKTSRRLRASERHYRKLFLFLTIVVAVLVLVMLFSGSAHAENSVKTVTTYQTITLEEGDSLWSIAQEHKLPSMETADYMEEISSINHLSVNPVLYEGQSLIIPVYTEVGP